VLDLSLTLIILVDLYVLHPLVRKNALESELAADAALHVAAEGCGDREQMVVVDPHRAGPHLLRDLERLRLVARPDRAAEAVDRVVGHADRVVDVLVADDAEHGAEDLLLRDLHRGI